MKFLEKSILRVFFLTMLSTGAFAGQFNLGVQYQGWNSNYVAPANFSGWEIWAPVNFNFSLDKAINVYASSEFGNAAYTDSLSGTPNTITLTGFSDTVIGSELDFTGFGVPSSFNIAFSIPSGDQTWESKQIASNIPTQFVESRYKGRGFGVDAMYGLSFPAGGANIGAAAGYLYSGAFNPNFGTPTGAGNQLKLGDSLFIALNYVQKFSGNQSQIIRLSGFYSLPTQQNSSNVFELGTNLNASYGWNNPEAFSFELGGQYYFAGLRPDINGNFTTEAHNSYGPRLYFYPSYAFSDFVITGRAKYVLPNGYAVSDPLYVTCVGGFLVGLEPSVSLKLDNSSALKFSISYDYIDAQNAAVDINANPTNVIYDRWTFGTSYQVKL